MAVNRPVDDVAIDPYGQIKVSDGEELSNSVPTAEDVNAFAVSVVAMDPGKAFVLKADSGVPYGDVDQVMDALKRAKVKVIYLLSDQVTVNDI